MTPTPNHTINLFSGAGGWEEGAPNSAIIQGYEIDPHATATAQAAGHTTTQCDVTTLNPRDYEGHCDTLIASPPCQTFSNAGTGKGRKQLKNLIEQVENKTLDTTNLDIKTRLSLEPLRWITTLHPYTIMMENVPQVRELWDAYATALHKEGYYTWWGVLATEQYGVPQTRRRAILIASALHPVATPPPIYNKLRGKTNPNLLPTPTMRQALGYTDDRYLWSNYSGSEKPEARKIREQKLRENPDLEIKITAQDRNRTIRTLDQPSTTITRRPHHWKFPLQPGEEKEKTTIFSVEDCAQLQSFRKNYPWQGSTGSQRLQVGNAIPPLLAQAVWKEALGENK